jgi:hypothetical protein
MAHGTESRRSNRLTLARGALSALSPDKWRGLCNVHGEAGAPVSRTVRVRVSSSPGASDELAAFRLPAGIWWQRGASVPWVGGGTTQCNGALKFEFGSQGVSRTIVCDLASGDYQVPSCELLYVEAVRYTPGSDAAAIAALGLDVECEVSAEISDGTAADFTPMILTAPSSWVGTALEANTIAVPGGAYAFDLYPDSPLGAANTFEVSPPGALRDFANGLIQPAGPLPIVRNLITVQSRGAGPVGASLVFFVR